MIPRNLYSYCEQSMELKSSISTSVTSMSPKKIATLAAFLLAALTADAQMRVDGNMRVDGPLKNNGNTLIAPGANIAGDGVIHVDGSIINNKWTPDAFTPASNASVVMAGTNPQTIGGTTPTNFPNLTIDNLVWVELLQDQTVKNQLTFQQWLLDLNGQNIDLGTTWSLSWESNASRATDIVDGGTITATRTLNAPTNQDPANLRLDITSWDNLGSTNIIRGHTQKVSTSGFGTYLWYVVTPTNTPTAVTNKVTYFDGELAGVSETELDQWQKNGPDWERQYGTPDVSNNYVTASSVWFGDTLTLGGTTSSPLPVTWANDFTTTCTDGVVDISRSVYTEINNSWFVVEHSTDGINRDSVWFVASHTGNSNALQSYSFTHDNNDQNGTSYYRLQQIDNDGQFDYSQVFGAYCDPIDTRTISVAYPNPTLDKIYITVLDNQETTLPILLTNTLGQKLMYREEMTIKGSKMITVDLSPYAAGSYFIKIGDQAQQIIKQ